MMGYTSKNLSLSLLALLAALTASPPPWVSAATTVVHTQQDLIAALRNESVQVAQLAGNLRLEPELFGTGLLQRQSDFVVLGGQDYPIFDFSFIEYKIYLAPGVRFTLEQVEVRNVRQKSGFEVDIFAASPNATVEYLDCVYYCFSCLPPPILVNLMYQLPKPPDEPNFPTDVSLGGTWCRTQPANTTLATCYNQNTINITSAAAIMAISGIEGVTSGGGYVVKGINVTFVCEDPVDEACSKKYGYDYCVRNQIQDMYKQDDTWRIIEGRTPGSPPPPLPSPSTSGGSKSPAIAGAVAGSIGGLALLAAVVASALWLRRRQRQHAAGGPSKPAGPTPGPDAPGLLHPGEPSARRLALAGADSGSLMSTELIVDMAAKRTQLKLAASLSTTLDDMRSDDVRLHQLHTPPSLLQSRHSNVPPHQPQPQPPHPQEQQQPHSNGPAPSSCSGGPPGSSPSLSPNPSLQRQQGKQNHPGGHSGEAGSGCGSLPVSSTGPSQPFNRDSSSTEHAAGAGQGGQEVDRGRQPGLVVAGIGIDLSTALGTGSFGRVYRGTWRGRHVAVKVMQYGSEVCREVYNEVQLSQSLSHPNLVASLHFVEVGPGGRVTKQMGSASIRTDSHSGHSGSRCLTPYQNADEHSGPRLVSGEEAVLVRPGSRADAHDCSKRGSRRAAEDSGAVRQREASGELAPVAARQGRLGSTPAVQALLMDAPARPGSAPNEIADKAAPSARLAAQAAPQATTAPLPPQDGETATPATLASTGTATRQAVELVTLPMLCSSPLVPNEPLLTVEGRGSHQGQLRGAGAGHGAGSGGEEGRQLHPRQHNRSGSMPLPAVAEGLEAAADSGANVASLGVNIAKGRQAAEGLAAQSVGGWGRSEDGAQPGSTSGDIGGDAGGQADGGGREAVASARPEDVLLRVAACYGPGGHSGEGGFNKESDPLAPSLPLPAPHMLYARSSSERASGPRSGSAKLPPMPMPSGRANKPGLQLPASGAAAVQTSPSTRSELTGSTCSISSMSGTTMSISGNTAATAAGGGGQLPGAPVSSGTAPGAPAAARGATGTGTGTGTGMASVPALGAIEAVWLAANAQPAEGSSHGFLVMELCEGGSLEKWRRARWRGQGETPNALLLARLALDIASGMQHLHQQGACHGDLKLANCLLAKQAPGDRAAHAQAQGAAGSVAAHVRLASGRGVSVRSGCGQQSPAAGGGGGGGEAAAPQSLGSAPTSQEEREQAAEWVVKVCDFGLSRVLAAGHTHVSTQPHGTATHLAPEVWAEGHVSQPADVYAFGITLWELATGDRPWRSLTPGAILQRVMMAGARPAVPLWLPPAFVRLMVSCWAQEPKDRPTFQAVAARLGAIVADGAILDPVRAGPAGPS